MAAASPVQRLKDEATCSLCRFFFKDPVTTECGDNFCCSCIFGRWKREGPRAPCPECGAICAQGTVRLNMKLLKMVEQVRLLSGGQRELPKMIEPVRQLPVQPERPMGRNLCHEQRELPKMIEQVRQRPVPPERPMGQPLRQEQRELQNTVEQARQLPVRPERPMGQDLCQEQRELPCMVEQVRHIPVPPERARGQPLRQEQQELPCMVEPARQRPVPPEKPIVQPLCQVQRELQDTVKQVRHLPVHSERARGQPLCQEHLKLLPGARTADLKPPCPVCSILAEHSALKPRPEAAADPEDGKGSQSRRETETTEASKRPMKKQNDGTEELRLILIGSTGAGKSATGNSILGRREFLSKPSAVPVTRQCQRGEVEWKCRTLVVVDTPDFLYPTDPVEELSTERERCAELSHPGPHALLLVLQAGRFTVEERESIQRIQSLFGKEALKFTVIVFTRKDDLEGETIEMFLSNCEEKLKELVRSCGGRVCAFNNRATGAEREQQLEGLIEVIHTMLTGNGGGYCSLGQDKED